MNIILFMLSLFISLSASQNLLAGLFNNFAQDRVATFPTDEEAVKLNEEKLIADTPLIGPIDNFVDFLSKVRRNYTNAVEYVVREKVFLARKQLAKDSNEIFTLGQRPYELGLNHLSDTILKELVTSFTGRVKHPRGERKIGQRKFHSAHHYDIPECFDWRKLGGVTEVKFQGKCGACWSFAVTGAIEGHRYRKYGELISLSEQQLIDCSYEYGNNGCQGGYHDYGFQYTVDHRGLFTENHYALRRKDGLCRTDLSEAGDIQDFVSIPRSNETMIKFVVATLGPVATSMYATESFMSYKSGIFSDEECNHGDVNHQVLIVGYCSQGGRDYWIIKNSWGKGWGEGGYARIPRNQNSFCGIAEEPSYPVV